MGITEYTRPTVTFRSITFSDGTTLNLDPLDTVLIVGPNNAGKTAILRELASEVARSGRRTVIQRAVVALTGDSVDLERLLREKAQLTTKRYPAYVGYKFEIPHFAVSSFTPERRQEVADAFVLFADNDARLRDSNPARSISFYEEKPTHPIHNLVMDDGLESQLSGYFHQAFGKDLLVFRAGGSEIPLMVGQKRNLAPTQTGFEAPYVKSIRTEFQPLQSQGDGMRGFTTVLLNAISITTQSVLLIDEPETFLHPPQARLLGEFIIELTTGKTQTFIATHSPDILQGVIASTNANVRIVRVHRRDNVNIVKELDAETVRNLAQDVLTRTSGIYSAIFRDYIIVCESDADALFYSALFDQPVVVGAIRPDIIAVQSGGKQRIARLVEAARNVGVPTAAIVDIDVLNNRELFRSLVVACGGTWETIEADWKTIHNHVSQQRARLTIDQLRGAAQEIFDRLKAGFAVDKGFGELRDLLRINSPWEQVKRSGRNGLAGEAVQAFDRLAVACGSIGLWIVPVGELEGFYRPEPKKGPAWVEQVLGAKHLISDPELEEARSFAGAVWNYLRTAKVLA